MSDGLLTKETLEVELLKKKVKGLSLIVEIIKDINSTLDLESLLKKIIEGATFILNSEIGSLMLFNQEFNCLTIKVAKGLSKKVIQETRIKVGESLSGWVFKHGKPLLISDIEKDSRFANKESSEKYYTKSFIGAPLIVKDKVMGVININNKISKDVFEVDDLWLLETFASEVAIAMDNSKLYEETKKRVEELSNMTKELAASKLVVSKVNLLLDKKLYDLTLINKINKVVNPASRHKDVVIAVVKVINEIIDYHILSFLLINEEEEGELFIDSPYSLDQGYLKKIKTQVIEKYNNFSDRLEFKENKVKEVSLNSMLVETSQVSNAEIASILFLPIKTANKVVGLIFLGQFKRRAFSKEDLRLLTLIRDHLMIILENSLLYEKLEKLSITDGLTKLAVHRHFQEALINELKNAAVDSHLVSLFMIDIDYFKEYNDRYGHPTGDIVLREIAQILLETTRVTDIVARYGGEEFGVILPWTNKEEAIVLGKRIIKKVESYKFPKEGNQKGKRITVSIGLATYPDDALTNVVLIEEADKALYQAKKEGKNQICFCKDLIIEYVHKLPIKAKKVVVLGDFNNWSKDKHFLENIGESKWRIKIKLFPGSYRYKFLINETIWLSDSQATEYIEDDTEEKVSLLVVK